MSETAVFCSSDPVKLTGKMAWLAEHAETERAEAERRVELIAERAARAATDAVAPWLDKRELAERLSCSVRWIELRMKEGMPRVYIAGRVKFKAAAVDDWLAANGHIKEREAD